MKRTRSALFPLNSIIQLTFFPRDAVLILWWMEQFLPHDAQSFNAWYYGGVHISPQLLHFVSKMLHSWNEKGNKSRYWFPPSAYIGLLTPILCINSVSANSSTVRSGVFGMSWSRICWETTDGCLKHASPLQLFCPFPNFQNQRQHVLSSTTFSSHT